MSREKATIGRILKDNGYWTSWFGKDHNTPEFQASQAGPFDQWPTGMGFDYFYGFVGGDANQWAPNLFRNTTAIYPYYNHPGWNLITAEADDAIEYLRRITAINSEQPFFIYYVPGAVHAPHDPTPEWIKKISDMHLFDEGWNKLRDTIFANQKRLGVIPQDAKLTPWPKDLLKEWDQLTPDEKKLFIRQADVFAAYFAYSDYEIGRVINEIDKMGKLDNTLIIYIAGDNGNSAEGTLVGTPNEVASLNGVELPLDVQMKFYDAWGSDQTYPHMAVGWTWAFDTPFSWTKQIASHFGGVRQGMAISWPAVIKDKGGIRNQFTHVIDIVPTILEATKIKAPEVVDGIKQAPIEGTSFMYTFDKANENAPSQHTTQYFEMLGDHAIYNDSWIASTKVMRPPWAIAGAVSQDPAKFPYELYDLTKDWTQDDNLAAQNPDKVKEMDELFWKEAEKYQVLPLDASFATRAVAPRPSLAAGQTAFNWTGEITGTPNGDAPSILNASYNFKAEVDIPQGGAEGMIVTQGGRFGGYGFYVLKGKPVFLYNFFDVERTRWEGSDVLSPGKHTLEFDFKYDGLGEGTLAFNNVSGIGRGGTGVLKVDGKEVAHKSMEHTIPIIFNGTRTSTSEPTPARRYRTITKCRSSSPARSTS
jgi:arylsulfatase